MLKSNKLKKQAATRTETENQDALKQAKKFSEYEQASPVQLELYRLVDLKPQHQEYYSNTIELYDFMPKYFWGKAARVNGKFLDPLDREFECKGNKYKIRITPAKITGKDGVTRDFYPSKREELVEDALRRFATLEQGVFLDDMAGVTFTLYQLQQELKRNGHTFNKNELKDALFVCAQSNLIVQSEDGSAVLMSSIFETVGLQTREDWEGQGTKTKAFVRFNSLVTESIKSGTYRQLNYEKSMSYKNVVARQLHKRMSHNYTQASVANRYEIKLSTIIRDFGLTEYARPSQNLAYIIEGLNEMKEKGVILNYSIDKAIDRENRRKIIDAKLSLQPHPFFASEVTQSNARQKRIKEELTGQSGNAKVYFFEHRKR